MPRLTATFVRRAPAAADLDTIFWDTQTPGFGLRSRHGRKTYVLQYRPLGGRGTRQRRLTLGSVASLSLQDARHLAQEYLRQVRYGHDPASARQASRNAPTMAELAERYLSEHAHAKKKPRSAASDRSNMALHVLPALGAMQVHAITTADIARLHHAMRATPGAANRVLALLSKMFSLAEAWGLRAPGSNPVRGLQRYPERKRERHLSAAELAQLGVVLRQAELEKSERPSVLALVRLLIFTGARLGEILELRWEQIDWEQGQARLADSKSGVKTLYLPPPALQVLRVLRTANARSLRGSPAREPREGAPRVRSAQGGGRGRRPSTEREVRRASAPCELATGQSSSCPQDPWCLPGRIHGQPLVNAQKPWRRLRQQAGIPDVHLHDLRHTFASTAARLGFSLPMIGALLGHTQPATTARYAHLVQDPVQEAAQLIGSELAQALGG